MRIVLCDYNPIWPGMFEAEKAALLEALKSAGPIIEHMGSTSVADLIAKPIIDVMVGLDDFSKADLLVPLVQQMGYAYFPQYEDVMPYRRFFKKIDTGGVTTHHIHMVEYQSGVLESSFTVS